MNRTNILGRLTVTLSFILLLSACGIFRQAPQKTDGPPPSLSKPEKEEPKKPVEEKPAAKAPSTFPHLPVK